MRDMVSENAHELKRVARKLFCAGIDPVYCSVVLRFVSIEEPDEVSTMVLEAPRHHRGSRSFKEIIQQHHRPQAAGPFEPALALLFLATVTFNIPASSSGSSTRWLLIPWLSSHHRFLLLPALLLFGHLVIVDAHLDQRHQVIIRLEHQFLGILEQEGMLDSRLVQALNVESDSETWQ